MTLAEFQAELEQRGCTGFAWGYKQGWQEKPWWVVANNHVELELGYGDTLEQAALDLLQKWDRNHGSNTVSPSEMTG